MIIEVRESEYVLYGLRPGVYIARKASESKPGEFYLALDSWEPANATQALDERGHSAHVVAEPGGVGGVYECTRCSFTYDARCQSEDNAGAAILSLPRCTGNV